MSERWCECPEHRSHDFRKLTDFYCHNFIPAGWKLQYTTLTEREDGRVLYITGKCRECGGFMRTGVSIAGNYTRDNLLRNICHAMLNYRPYAGKGVYGLYQGGVSQRLEWYWRQDQLLTTELIEQFVALFHEKDQLAARRWAKENMPENIPRETSTEFFNAVIKLVQSNGFWPEQSAFITCEPTCPSWPPEAVVCHPRFDFRTELKMETDGALRIDCYLDGIFDRFDNSRLLIGTIKKTCTDRDSCLIMGSLTGALLHYGNAYRDENLERYIPHKTVKLPEWQLRKEGE